MPVTGKIKLNPPICVKSSIDLRKGSLAMADTSSLKCQRQVIPFTEEDVSPEYLLIRRKGIV
jgi:hypothetical protein